MNRFNNIFDGFPGFIKAALIFFILTVSTMAIKVDYVGSINDSLRAPTALTVGDEYIAVLEPIGKQLKIYTSDGSFRKTKIHHISPSIERKQVSDRLRFTCYKNYYKKRSIIESELKSTRRTSKATIISSKISKVKVKSRRIVNNGIEEGIL